MIRAAIRRSFLLVALSVFAATPVAAQEVATIDEGTFRLVEKGRDIGTETFSIVQRGSGEEATILARGEVSSAGGSETQLQVQTAGTLRPAGYVIRVTGGEDRTISGRLEGRRMRASIESAGGRGQNVREYLVSDGAILAEPRVAHHHYFVVERAVDGATRIPLIIPSENRQVFAEVSIGAAEPVSVAGQSMEGRRVTIRPEGGEERVVWVDAGNRVLRFEIPALEFVAERMTSPS
ncbi:MAG: hypothetical protein ACREL7_09005 [Longimicrobiales bacterium]